MSQAVVLLSPLCIAIAIYRYPDLLSAADGGGGGGGNGGGGGGGVGGVGGAGGKHLWGEY